MILPGGRLRRLLGCGSSRLQGICFRAGHTGNGQNGDGRRGARGYGARFRREATRISGVGGPLWTHWGGFAAIPGINQIVGHTQGAEVREKIGEQSWNYCIDVGNAEIAAILCDGGLEILER